MKAKKPVAKSSKKPSKPQVVAKSKSKKAAPPKVTAKKSVAKSSAAKKPAAKPVKSSVKPLSSPKATKKAQSFSLKSAATKLKSAFSKKPAPASKKMAAAKPTTASAKSVDVKIQAPIKSPAKTAPVPMPKGMLTEDRIRKMSDKEYMNDAQLSFFRYRLLQMRNEVLARELDVKERLHQREVFADPADRATAEEEHWLDLRLRERESLLLRKIDDALRRIADREFGYCEKTGDPIGIPRLLARPTATVCVDVKGQDERIESQFRDR